MKNVKAKERVDSKQIWIEKLEKILQENRKEMIKCIEIKKILEAKSSSYWDGVDNKNYLNGENMDLVFKVLQIEKGRRKDTKHIKTLKDNIAV